MTALIIALIAAGIIAGLIQFFADYKGLPLFPGEKEGEGFDGAPPEKSFWQKLYDFVRNHWQFFGYQVVGIAGAFLVPVFDQFVSLKGVRDYLNCIDNNPGTACTVSDWYLLVILGYGIILGYSSVRLIRSLGSFLMGNIARSQAEQQKQLADAKKQIDDLKAKLAAPGQPQPFGGNWQGFDSTFQQAANTGDDVHAQEELSTIAGFESCAENPNPKPWTNWRPAASLRHLLGQVNALAPGRSKVSDGMIGDTAHQSRNSDHNPWIWDAAVSKGVVTALDITHDPGNKCDCNVLANVLQLHKDERIKYVIWNRRIMNSSPINGAAAWEWRNYSGANPHDKHIHISVKCDKPNYDSTKNWNIKLS